jgi:hypothetical protein
MSSGVPGASPIAASVCVPWSRRSIQSGFLRTTRVCTRQRELFFSRGGAPYSSRVGCAWHNKTLLQTLSLNVVTVKLSTIATASGVYIAGPRERMYWESHALNDLHSPLRIRHPPVRRMRYSSPGIQAARIWGHDATMRIFLPVKYPIAVICLPHARQPRAMCIWCLCGLPYEMMMFKRGRGCRRRGSKGENT